MAVLLVASWAVMSVGLMVVRWVVLLELQLAGRKVETLALPLVELKAALSACRKVVWTVDSMVQSLVESLAEPSVYWMVVSKVVQLDIRWVVRLDSCLAGLLESLMADTMVEKTVVPKVDTLVGTTD